MRIKRKNKKKEQDKNEHSYTLPMKKKVVQYELIKGPLNNKTPELALI